MYERLDAIDRLNTTMKLLLPRILCALGLVASGALAQEVIPLYPGTPPGSVETSYPEKHYFSKPWNAEVVSNVTKPSLTLYRPIAGGNGNAAVVCPGGGFMALSIDNEGTEVAKWLAARGMTAFVLKYRLAHTGEDATQEFLALFEKKPNSRKCSRRLYRSRSPTESPLWHMYANTPPTGAFLPIKWESSASAGGTVTAAAGLRYTPESRPAFVAPIYPAASMLKDDAVPADAPPMFLAAATDDQFKLVPDSISLYNRWIAASKSAELHIYAKGGHGFGMRKQGYPTDQWIDRFAEWLDLQGFMKR